MRSLGTALALGLAVGVGGCLPPPPNGPGPDQAPGSEQTLAQRVAALEEELARLKREGAGSSGTRQGLEALTVEVENLRQEVRSQQGSQEVMKHRLDRLAERQRRLYEDIDARLRALEQGGGRTGEAPGASEKGGAGTPGGEGAEQARSEESAYKAAFAKIEANEYEAAASAFQRFLSQYPDSDLAPNARYWLGESHYVLREFEQALSEFNKVLKEHPESRKAPAALLKIGYSFYELGEYDGARQVLQRLRERFPDSSEARLARQRINRMEEEGH